MKRQSKIKKLEESLEFLIGDSVDIFILFVDLCGSTDFKQDVPEFTWISRELIFLRRAAELVKNYGGTVVKTVGDELIAIFQANTLPEQILKCATEILQSFENLKAFRGKARIESKVSLDFGQTYNGSIIDTALYDPIGTPVDRCARLNAVAKNNEIIFSQDFLSAMLANSSDAQLKEKYAYETREEDLKGLGTTVFYCIATA